MSYKVTLKLKDGDDVTFEITAKTKLARKMKINSYMERKKIREGNVLETIVEGSEDEQSNTM